MACGELAAQNLFGRRAKEAVILPNAIDLERFAPDPQAKARLGLEGRCLLFVGRFARRKTYPFAAFALARRRRPMTLLLLGRATRKRRCARAPRSPTLPGTSASCRRAIPRRGTPRRTPSCCPRCTRGSPLSDWKRSAGLPCLFSDKITRAADVCGSAAFLPLGGRSGRKRWQKICPPYRRRRAAARAGYDIRQEGRLCEVYERAVLPFLTDTFLGEEKDDRQRTAAASAAAGILAAPARAAQHQEPILPLLIGVLWTVLNPLLNMLVMTLVFSKLFGDDPS